MDYLTTTFSPAMIASDKYRACVQETSLDNALSTMLSSEREIGTIPIADGRIVSAVGHEVTARVLSALIGRVVPFSRKNLVLSAGDRVLCIIPSFRSSEAREFSREEVEAAGFRCFIVVVR